MQKGSVARLDKCINTKPRTTTILWGHTAHTAGDFSDCAETNHITLLRLAAGMFTAVVALLLGACNCYFEKQHSEVPLQC